MPVVRLTIYGKGAAFYKCTKCGGDAVPLSTVERFPNETCGQFIDASYCRDCRLIMTPLGCVDP